MVIEDKNKDGNFEDNIPDGVTDPFGWQSENLDPWPNYNFLFGGIQRKGNKSYYLWIKAIANLSNTLPSNGGFFELERYNLNFPQGATTEDLTVKVVSVPTVNQSKSVRSIGSGIMVTARNSLGNLVNNFYKYFTIAVTFNPFDINSYKSDSISIYSSSDGINWTKEETLVDLSSKTAVTQVNHLSYFALMAERLDTISPVTNAILNGQKGDNDWFKNNVEVSLDAQDNEGGLGVEYTLYRIDEEDWQQYMKPFVVSDEGNYKIEFYSVDSDENIEKTRLIEINIDKTQPVVSLLISPLILWPPNGKMMDVKILGSLSDNFLIRKIVFEIEDEYNEIEPVINNFGDVIKLEAKRSDDDLDGREYKIKVTVFDWSGNEAVSSSAVIVPHDQRK